MLDQRRSSGLAEDASQSSTAAYRANKLLGPDTRTIAGRARSSAQTRKNPCQNAAGKWGRASMDGLDGLSDKLASADTDVRIEPKRTDVTSTTDVTSRTMFGHLRNVHFKPPLSFNVTLDCIRFTECPWTIGEGADNRQTPHSRVPLDWSISLAQSRDPQQVKPLQQWFLPSLQLGSDCIGSNGCWWGLREFGQAMQLTQQVSLPIT